MTACTLAFRRPTPFGLCATFAQIQARSWSVAASVISILPGTRRRKDLLEKDYQAEKEHNQRIRGGVSEQC
jgi:hypothetical protein